jgi:hypothetical protein
MNIEFIGPASISGDGGIDYPAKLNGQNLMCHFSYEALEDIDPDVVLGDPLEHFSAHQLKLLSVAEQKILHGQVQSSQIHIYSNDLIFD